MAWAPDYITDGELKHYEQIPDDADAGEIAWAITTASRAVDKACNEGHRRQFGLCDEPEQRFYTPWWSIDRGRWVVDVDDFMTTVDLVVAVDVDDVFTPVIGNMRRLPLNAAQNSRPWERLVLPDAVDVCGSEGEVAVTVAWGWSVVPVPVQQATALQAARLLARRSSPYGVAGSPDAGSEIRLLARVDPDVKVSLEDYVRKGVTLR